MCRHQTNPPTPYYPQALPGGRSYRRQVLPFGNYRSSATFEAAAIGAARSAWADAGCCISAETVDTPVTTAASVSDARGLLCAHPETAESGRRQPADQTAGGNGTAARSQRTGPRASIGVRGSFRVASATANRGLGGGAVACRLDSGYSTPSRLANNVRTTSAPMNQATAMMRGPTEWTRRPPPCRAP